MEAGWEHVVCQVSRDHGTKEREEERRTCRGTTIKAGKREREKKREESKGGENEDQEGEDEEGIGE